MTIEQGGVIDFSFIEKTSGDLWLTISDHLPWEEMEGERLVLLQNKLNAYLRFIESGEIFGEIPSAKGRNIVINIAAKFPMTETTDMFFQKARTTVEAAGFHLRHEVMDFD